VRGSESLKNMHQKGLAYLVYHQEAYADVLKNATISEDTCLGWKHPG
jgi:hypothetical protein